MPGRPRAEALVGLSALDLLMLRERQIGGAGQAAGSVWEGGERFYGTRVGPGWYQGTARVARGCQVPFSVLRMLMQTSRKPHRSEGRTQNAVHPPQYRYGGGIRHPQCCPPCAVLPWRTRYGGRECRMAEPSCPKPHQCASKARCKPVACVLIRYCERVAPMMVHRSSIGSPEDFHRYSIGLGCFFAS